MPTLSTKTSSVRSTPVLHDLAVPIPQVAYRRIKIAQTQNSRSSPLVRSIRMPTQRRADTSIWMTCLINRLVLKFEITRLQSRTYLVISLEEATWSRVTVAPSCMGRPGSYRHSRGPKIAALMCHAGETFRRAVILVIFSQYVYSTLCQCLIVRHPKACRWASKYRRSQGISQRPNPVHHSADSHGMSCSLVRYL